jgi:hypothetical protein
MRLPTAIVLCWLVAVTPARADDSAPDLLDPPRADAPTEVEVDLYLDDRSTWRGALLVLFFIRKAIATTLQEGGGPITS